MATTARALAILGLASIATAQYGAFGSSSPRGGGPSSSSSSFTTNGGFGTFGNAGNSEGTNSNAFSNNGRFGGFGNANMIRLAHGVLASLAFVIFFPFGAISIRLFKGRAAFILHVIFQVLAFLLYVVAFGMGVWMVNSIRFVNFWTNTRFNYHPIIGATVLAFLILQPILGIIHHRRFKKHQRRQFWSYAHIWIGRIVITIGIINGGLGLYLANNVGFSGYVAYGVVAGFIWLIWTIAAVRGEVRRARGTGGKLAKPRGGILKKSFTTRKGKESYVESDDGSVDEGTGRAKPAVRIRDSYA